VGEGWAERNAGNISVNISGFFPGIPKGKVFPGKGETSLIRPHPYLKDQTFLVTGTGTRMRELASDPGHSLLIVRINGSEMPIRNISLPTTELNCNLLRN
jgi:ribulose-5-phosphate 4-epimerase/fuculose-1-phosphate aldolase